VVVLQEFESASFAQVLAEDYFPELGYRHFQGHESNNWYMNVVVMSRIPLGTFYSYSPWTLPIEGFTEEDGSPSVQNLVNNRMWTVEVLPSQNYQFLLTGLHLKAGRGERNEAWRLSQIKALRTQFTRFEQLYPDQNHVVVGDLNCTPDSYEFRYLLAGDSVSNGPLFVDPLADTGVFSHPADSVFWRIDHILPNKQMKPELLSDSPFGPFTPFSPDSMRAISDHLPMRAFFLAKDEL
jgi:endonuclease/exonuclease/phosphatase family metal-dependent hydrolase